MPLLRILLTGFFAVIALVAGMFIAAIGLIALALGRLLGRPGGGRGQTHFTGRRPSRQSTVPAGSGDVIDVMATEVPADTVRR